MNARPAVIDRPADADALAQRFDALGQFVRVAWGHVAADPAVSDVDASAVAAAGVLSERAGHRLRLSGDHTVVALAGATGSGKSSLFNALARMDLSAAGYLRPTTGAAHACVWGDQDADTLLDWLGVVHRFRRESVLDARDEAPLHGLVLLDLPDLDSVATGHRLEADRLVGVVDLVIWVLDPQKYADRTVHDEYLRRMGPLREVTMVVFNQIDRLSPADTQRCVADLTRLVEADGLPGVPVLATSAVTGEGVADLRARLERTIAGRHAALARLEGELNDTVDGLIPLVRAGQTDTGDEFAVAGLADRFADAAGVEAIADAAARSYQLRSRVPGRPFAARTPRGRVDVPPADPAAVAVAVRQLAGEAGQGLPAPWPDRIQAAAGASLDHVPDDLGRELSQAVPPVPGRRGWTTVRVVWWLSVLAFLAGVAGVVADRFGWTVRGHHPLVPAAVLGGVGLVLAVALPLISRPIARRRARRYADRVRDQLREQAQVVATESVAPAWTVLHEYRLARACLQAAARRSPASGTAGPVGVVD